MSINANEKGSTAYAIEPYFLYKKDHRARGGTQRWSAAGYYRNQRGGVTQFGELREASCNLGSNEIQ